MLAVLSVFIYVDFHSGNVSDKQERANRTEVHEESAANGASPRLPGSASLPSKENFDDELYGNATPALPFPRGVNQKRRYAKPVTREISDQSGLSAPAMMAKLPADGRTELMVDEIDTYTKAARRMAFNADAFDQILTGTTARLRVPTTGEDLIEIHFETIKTRSARTHTLQGKIVGEPLSQVQFVYHDGIVHGNVTHPMQALHYEYRILSDGYLMVRELDHAAMTATCGKPDEVCGEGGNCGHQHHEDLTAAELIQEELDDSGVALQTVSSEEGTVAAETTGWVTVDVVIGYGREARIADNGVSQIEARLLDAIDRMNQAFDNSEISNTEMMLLGTIEDPDYVFPGATDGSMSSGDELGDLSNESDGILDAVSDYANLLGADFKAFVVKQADGSAGIAYRPGNSSITARNYITSTRLTFAHELGHNLGCDHSWGDSSQSYKGDYGWRFDGDGDSGTNADRLRTIMAYDWGWGQGIRAPYYANPNVLYGSAPTGAELGYDATGDIYADQRYVTGGLGYNGSNENLSGFDGTNPSLGALNYLTILTGQGNSRYGAEYAAARSTRTAVNVEQPQANDEYLPGQTMDIFFTGGDHTYTASITLYKGAAIDTNIATDINPATDRNTSWVIPANQAPGDDYFIRVTLTHPTDGDVTLDSGFFSIFETVGFSASEYSITENGGSATITVNRIGSASGDISVDYATSDGTATDGIDYTGTSGTFNWPAGDSDPRTFTIPITDDSDHEDPVETVTITLSNPVGGSVLGTNPVNLNIIEDDNQVPSVAVAGNQTVYLVGVVSPDPVAGADIFLDAGLDDGADVTWEDSLAKWDLSIDAAVSYVQDAGSGYPGIVSAYDFPGGQLGTGGCEGPGLQDMGADTQPITLELWFKPDASASYPSNGQVLWETGGGTGLGIFYNNGVIETAHDSNDGQMSWDVSSLTGEFIQVVVTYDPSISTDNYKLYVNGELKVTSSRSDSDMCGGDNSGLGERGENNVGGAGSGDSSTESFDGKIAIFRSYHNQILDDAGVLQNFESVAVGASATISLDGIVSDGDDDPLITTWTLESGPAPVTFGDPDAVDTTVRFTAAGNYTIRLTADDGYEPAWQDFTVEVFEESAVTYTVDFQTDGTAGASLSGETSQVVGEGSNSSPVSANAPSGYHFAEWTQLGSFYSFDNPLTVINVTADMTLVANFVKTASISLTDDGSIMEADEDGETIVVSLADGIFTDPITAENWSLIDQPAGVVISSVTRIDDTTVRIILGGNRTVDYDTDITGMTVSCTAAEVVSAVSALSANTGVTFTATDDAEFIEITDDGWIQEGAEDGELITVILNGGTFSGSLNAENWALENLPAGVSKGTVTRVDDDVVTVALSGNSTGSYGGTDIANLTVTCTTDEYNDSTGDSPLSDSNGVTMRALDVGSASFQDGVGGYSGTRDTYIDYDSPNSNFGTGTNTTMLLNNRTSPSTQQQDKHGLLYFDLSSIPSGTIVTGVSLELTDDGGIAGTFQINGATGSSGEWAEDGATYNTSSAQLGGTTFGSASAPGTANSTITLALNQEGITAVQSWINGATNYGFTMTSDLTGPNDISRIRTREYATPEDRPKLTITYESGGAATPEINLQGNALSIVSGDTTPSTADGTDFGTAFTGGAAVAHTFTVQNLGAANLNLSGSPAVDLSGAHAEDFSITSEPASTVIPGDSTTFEVTFTPGSAGIRTAVVTIANDDSDEDAYTFTVSGEGVIAPVSYPVDYDGNGNTGGTAPVDSLSPYSGGATVVVLGNSGSLVRTGYTFNDWNTADDGTGAAYSPGASFTISGDTTLYAQWSANVAGFTLSQSTAIVNEDGGTDSFTVVLDSQPASDVVFDVSSSDEGEVTVSPASLSFTSSNWDVPQTVTITGVDDSLTTEDAATVSVTVDDAQSEDAYDTLSEQTVAVTCSNDDIPGIIVGAISGDTSEHGTTATFSVALGTQPTADVTIGLSSSDAGEGTVSPSSLTFGTTDWDSPQTVTVTGTDDAEADGEQNYDVVTAVASSTDSDYDGIDPADVSLSNADNESIVSYDGNGNDGGSAPAEQTKIFNTDLTLSDQGSLTRTGYDFDGWNTASDGSGTPYAGGATYSVEENITLYAQWASGPTVIYEPFTDSDSTLNGNTSGFGLSGTWSGSASVVAGSLDYGDLPTATGNKVSFSNQNGGVATGTSLSDAGLLEDGVSLWFSVLVQTGSDIATNGDFGFAFGSESLNSGNNIPIQNSGGALGFTFKNNQLRACHWAPSLTRSSDNAENSAAPETLYLVVGKITWGAASDTIEIYKVPTDLNLGSPVSSYTTVDNIDQSLFDTISVGTKAADPNHFIDEIRFGATYESVVGQVVSSSYSVTYDGNGSDSGSVPVDGNAYALNDSVTVLGNTGSLEREGFTFGGWNTASDGSGTGYIAEDSFNITDDVTLYAQWEVNNVPVANDQSVSTIENVALEITLSASDANDDSLSYTIETPPGNGTLSGTAPNLIYTPAPDFTGSDSFTFTANDGTAGSNTATVSILVLSPFESWAGEGSQPDNDSNGDGTEDSIAWVLGAGDPSEDVTALLPTSDNVSETNYFIYIYRRADAAHEDTNTTIEAKYGSNLNSWTTAVHDGSNVIITERDDHYGDNVDQVEVKVHRDLASDARMFMRLVVVVAP
ncbi:hypothetical protein DDZ13_14045 [Coraliomargarita sinensis]|uniref:PKD domain-containing protein n=1 Tax=Coraliomargarita sinensis TaxID=2174842 RepID=A0A317ZCV1_9BACT|nr:hypothetical protein DDZ13_14045 [Coraliomargarita sinensis]